MNLIRLNMLDWGNMHEPLWSNTRRSLIHSWYTDNFVRQMQQESHLSPWFCMFVLNNESVPFKLFDKTLNSKRVQRWKLFNLKRVVTKAFPQTHHNNCETGQHLPHACTLRHNLFQMLIICSWNTILKSASSGMLQEEEGKRETLTNLNVTHLIQ